MPARLNDATIGIQNADHGHRPGAEVQRGIRAQQHGDPLRVADALAVGEPDRGHRARGRQAIVTVGFDAAGLCGDAYNANLHVLSNDPDSPDVAVPVTLNLLGAPDAQVAPTNLAFGDVYLSQNAVLAAGVANVGCATLQITGLSIDNPVFTADLAAPFSVAAGATQAINVTFTPVAAGLATGIADPDDERRVAPDADGDAVRHRPELRRHRGDPEPDHRDACRPTSSAPRTSTSRTTAPAR